MAANTSLIILIFEMILFLTTVTSVKLSDFEPISKEVEIAIQQTDLPETMKEAISNDYINLGGYSNSFIGLLDSYWTMSCSPIRFDEKEKSLLTLSSAKDPIEYKVGTQLKYYRKMQEVQCTDYFILYYYLFNAQWNIQHIIQHVYNMIKMAYLGKFVVFPWLLKLHINLLTPSGWTHDAWISQFTRDGLYDLEQYKKSLDQLISMCVKHNYLDNENSKGCSSTILDHDNFNTQLHVHFNTNISPLPFSFDYLYLSDIRKCEQRIEPITSVTTGWNIINEYFKIENIIISEQLSTENWITDPFKHIEFQHLFLDIVTLKLYCFIWTQIYAYQWVTVSKYKYRLDTLYRLHYFMSLITDIVEFVDIEDKTLNVILTLYSTLNKGKPNHEQNEKLLKIVTSIINNMKKTMAIPDDAVVANISDEDLKTERSFNLILGKIEKAFLVFGKFLKTILNGFSLNILLFFVNGVDNTELAVFP